MMDINEWVTRIKPLVKINDQMDIVIQMRKVNQASFRPFKVIGKG